MSRNKSDASASRRVIVYKHAAPGHRGTVIAGAHELVVRGHVQLSPLTLHSERPSAASTSKGLLQAHLPLGAHELVVHGDAVDRHLELVLYTLVCTAVYELACKLQVLLHKI
eukprot:TRINITY_DN7915_c0_g1_i1.p2 TRINITY_DN7915_c0_g1~~TRINITY_DN7915_c0_g1_i1.p2  ORF type:complete len:112 (-),score=8.28 TRINITY_DN7915_c0_g1_i1:223-558(-)